MQPLFFGKPDKPLFGIYHPPLTRADRGTGVVLCSTFGSEYLNSHRALRQFAVRLSRVGFHALRFDYYGSGDSGGNSDEGDVDQWKKDISFAIEELKNRAGLSNVSLVGLRVGATLATMVAGERNDVESLMLWEPVLNTRGYIEELGIQHRDWLGEQLFSELNLSHQKDGGVEIIGFPLTNRFRLGLESIDLLSLERCAAKHVLIVRSSNGAKDQSFVGRLEELGASPNYMEIATQNRWLQREGIDQVVVPNEVLDAMILWMTEIHV
ncbi:MAG: alpha/beta hydrolase [Acidobacteriia bacterium]|nr:alpha/beta hydrolase [Terriglobia bacterium]